GFRLYLGGEDQLPDPDIEAYLGIGNVNAYRGTAYIVFANFDLTDYGDRIPQFRFEVVGTSSVQTTGSIAVRRSGSGSSFYSRSPDGRDWGPWISQDQINTRIIPGRDRFVSMVNLQPYRYTESGMQGWGTSDGATHSGTSGAHKGWADSDGVFVAATGGSGAQRSRISRDNASSFELTSGSSPVLQVCKVGDVWVGRRNHIFYRAIDPDSWTEFAQEPDLSWGSARWSNGDLAMFGGADSPSNGTPTVYANAGGMSLEKQSIPSFSNSTQVSALCYGLGLWIAATDGGEIGYRDSSGWHLSDFVFPGICSEMSFNGSRIIAAVENGSTGHIFVCEGNPNSWDEVWSGDIGFSGSLTVGSLLPRPFDSGIRLSDVVEFLHRRTESHSFDAAVLSDTVDEIGRASVRDRGE